VNYGSKPLLRQHKGLPTKSYGDYRECLRFEFSFRCAYCLSHEAEVGPGAKWGNFEIDHFRPFGRHEFRRLENTYTNLLWSCYECNRAKRNTWPSTAVARQGYRFVDPCVDGLSAHLTIKKEFVVHLSPAGKYTVDYLRLNSEVQQHRRRERAKLARRLTALGLLVKKSQAKAGQSAPSPELTALTVKIALLEQALREEIAQTKARLGAPWDAPDDCWCNGVSAAAAGRRASN